MPKISKSKRSARASSAYTKNNRKRLGNHHKKKKSYIKVYAPYLPLLVSLIVSLFISFWQPKSTATLAYATNMSVAGLLSATNTQRASNGRASLTINSKLTSAAQAKANHMIANNYWSHTTPDGQEPWVFIQNAGYAYTKAGENLAYGFATSADAVIGWMNSPSHKANMLDSAFTEVGFGFANGSNYNNSGEQTVVVAMYGQPQVLASSAPTSPSPPLTQSAPVASQIPPTAQPAPKPTTPQPQLPKRPSEDFREKEPDSPAPVTSDIPVKEASPVSQNIAKAQTLTNGNAPWTLGAAVLITGTSLIIILARYSLKARRFIKGIIHDTEQVVLHNPLIDSLLISLLIIGVALSRTVGTIL